ncbi:glycoside hydrolase family 32 protein [Halosegnis sp.]|uniref:glycoside hydrolase family 32 protein n=1 Tax=Halosegnis sp. TaxID=2864959 RepID=UPI0035D49030
MDGSPRRVGFLHDGGLTAEQHAALAWLEDAPFDAGAVAVEDLNPDRWDVLWWHRDAPLEADNPLVDAPAVESFLADGGGLLLTLRGMAAVDALNVESVPPDATGVDTVTEPTGPLWRRLYDDHPAVAALDGRRFPVCDRGAVPFARYETVLPARGEVLASTIRGEQDIPHEMTVVAWDEAPGTVLGVGAPLAFDEPVPAEFAAQRDALTAGLLRATTTDTDHARPKTAAGLHAMRETVDDPARPGYHFTPPANWLNDPNGLIKWNGRYHVFYQYNPAGPFHNTIHWGHAVSDDLIHWTDEPVALAPSPEGPDRDGCWSGCAVDDDGTATILYTGGDGRTQLPCLATTDDHNLCQWEKHGNNPVIEAPPAELDILETEHWRAEFRDHSIWRANGEWHQIIGTGLADRGGAALLYTSTDLREWHYQGPLLVGDDGPGTVWECPELLDLGEKQLLHVSNYENVAYFLGEQDGTSFDVQRRGLLDHGDFYAPQSMRDGDRVLMWGWLPEARDLSAQWDAGWSGALSLPRVLSTGPAGRLRQRPAAEVAQLRERPLPAPETVTLAPDAPERVTDGSAIELQMEVTLADAEAVELSVLASPDGTETTTLRYTKAGELVLDRTDASEDHRATADTRRMSVPPYDEPLSLRVFIDQSVVEVFANERRCLTARVYPTREDSTGVSLVAEGGRASVADLACWEMETGVAHGDEPSFACAPLPEP